MQCQAAPGSRTNEAGRASNFSSTIRYRCARQERAPLAAAPVPLALLPLAVAFAPLAVVFAPLAQNGEDVMNAVEHRRKLDTHRISLLSAFDLGHAKMKILQQIQLQLEKV